MTEKSPWNRIEAEENSLEISKAQILKKFLDFVTENNFTANDTEQAFNLFISLEDFKSQESDKLSENYKKIKKLSLKIKNLFDDTCISISIPELKTYLLQKISETESGFKSFLQTLPIDEESQKYIESICNECKEGIFRMIGHDTAMQINILSSDVEKVLEEDSIEESAKSLQKIYLGMSILEQSEGYFAESIPLLKENLKNESEKYRARFFSVLRNLEFPSEGISIGLQDIESVKNSDKAVDKFFE